VLDSDKAKLRQGGIGSGLFFAVLFLLVLAVGIALHAFVIEYAERQERLDLQELATAMVTALDPTAVAQLTASSEDLGTRYFSAVKKSLSRLKSLSEDYAFVYLMGQRDGQIMFLADAEAEGSPDYSAPGEIYAEASSKLKQIFVDGQPFVEGPIVDSYGTWISAHAPILNPESGEIIAIIGADISARNWQEAIRTYRLFANVITFLLAGIVSVFAVLLSRIARHRNRLHKVNLALEQSLNDVKNLEGVIPICMYCKGIRDDEESWHKLEKYIADHSSAEFSHGICPSCMQERYPETD